MKKLFLVALLLVVAFTVSGYQFGFEYRSQGASSYAVCTIDEADNNDYTFIPMTAGEHEIPYKTDSDTIVFLADAQGQVVVVDIYFYDALGQVIPDVVYRLVIFGGGGGLRFVHVLAQRLPPGVSG